MFNTRPHWRAIETPFVVGHVQPDTPRSDLPLERFLPPWHEGMASRWLNNYAPPGSWLLDPFGQSPFSVLELAKSGYRVLVTANNPIAAFIIEVLASAPDLDEMQATLKQLGDSKSSRGQRLEDQIREHYLVKCPNPSCSEDNDQKSASTFEVSQYLWHEDQAQAHWAHRAIGNCQSCGYKAEIELQAEDLANLPPLPPAAMNRALALEKIARPGDPLRFVMEDVINFYTERTLSLLLTILTRIENSNFSPRQKTLMNALFLSAADKCNQLWAYPLGKNRPRQLSRPPVFQEFNVWHALEDGCRQWSSFREAITLCHYPGKLPQSGGICLFNGRLRELSPALDVNRMAVVYANLPRRNQAWWNLSGLWSGWLWGREGVKTLRNSLLKQRYDWTWHSIALEKVLVQLNNLVRTATPILLQISELDPLFLIASVKAAQKAGFSLRTAAISGNVSILQSVWKMSPTKETHVSPVIIRDNARDIAKTFLSSWGEPSGYQRLFTQMILSLQSQGLLFQEFPALKQSNVPINKVQEDLDPVFSDARLFHRFNPGISTDTGSYWLARPPERYTALADSVEDVIRHAFLHTKKISALELASVINKSHPGLMTPEHDLVQNILRSYASYEDSDGTQSWTLNSYEDFAVRKEDIRKLREIIEKIARRLQLNRQLSDDAIYYLDEHDHELYTFFVSDSAIISETIQNNKELSGKKLIVLPGSRANLISYKLRRDPSLQALMGEDWHFVKFRLFRNLYDNPLLTRELFASQILDDPPEYRAAQLALF